MFVAYAYGYGAYVHLVLEGEVSPYLSPYASGKMRYENECVWMIPGTYSDE